MASRETFEQLMQKCGVGPWQLAQRAKVGHQSVRRWIHGEVGIRLAQAKAVADALGVSVERVLRAAGASRR